jgi:hypothetical protein
VALAAPGFGQARALLAPNPSPLLWDRGRPDPVTRLTSPQVARPASEIPATYWKEGAAAGAVLLGLGAGVLASGLCNEAEGEDGSCGGRTIAGVLLGGAIGFGLGALIGGQFRKTRAVPRVANP